MKLTLKQAIIVAKTDYEHGIIWAIDKLAEMGFDCRYYYKTMAQIEDVDKDNLNLKTRDKQFALLGISEIMNRAYDKVC
jgi:hypothetical protein